MVTSMSPQYSHISCRHGPQGVPGSSLCVTTAIAVNSRSPAASAVSRATRSAQTVSAYVQFSTLQPRYTLPLFVCSAAPTLYFENGATAFSRAFVASEMRSVIGRAFYFDGLRGRCFGEIDLIIS